MILNEFDEILCSQRLEEGHEFHLKWQFPGGYLEFGETFEECAVREVYEECDAVLDPKSLRYVATMNVRGVEFGYHNVGIFMVAPVVKGDFKYQTTEPEKNTEWRWMKWDEFKELPNLFNPFKFFFEQGLKELSVIKAKVGLI